MSLLPQYPINRLLLGPSRWHRPLTKEPVPMKKRSIQTALSERPLESSSLAPHSSQIEGNPHIPLPQLHNAGSSFHHATQTIYRSAEGSYSFGGKTPRFPRPCRRKAHFPNSPGSTPQWQSSCP